MKTSRAKAHVHLCARKAKENAFLSCGSRQERRGPAIQTRDRLKQGQVIHRLAAGSHGLIVFCHLQSDGTARGRQDWSVTSRNVTRKNTSSPFSRLLFWSFDRIDQSWAPITDEQEHCCRPTMAGEREGEGDRRRWEEQRRVELDLILQ